MPVDLKGALDLLDTGAWVSIAYVSYDEKRGTAGDMVRINKCRLAAAATPSPSGRPGGAAAAAGTTHPPATSADRRDPNHKLHATRQLKLHNGQLRKAHIYLIVAIKGQKLL